MYLKENYMLLRPDWLGLEQWPIKSTTILETNSRLLYCSVFVFTFDLGEGSAVIESRQQVEPGKWYSIEAERTATEGSLIINGGIAVKGRFKPCVSVGSMDVL